MLIIPAIDIKNGKCVRLTQGKADKETVYYENPLECAKHWQSLGAERLHLVDLDGAFQGNSVNFEVISNIISGYPSMQIQVGGGIRDVEAADRYLTQAGADYIIIGTIALENPQLVMDMTALFPGKVYISLDIMQGKIYSRGWQKETSVTLADIFKNFINVPLAGFIVTDIKNDGMLTGVDVSAFTHVAQLTSLPVIAAGGITDLQDIKLLKNSGKISGAICGKSLYEKTLDLRQALSI